jgi:hypothetical protein
MLDRIGRRRFYAVVAVACIIQRMDPSSQRGRKRHQPERTTPAELNALRSALRAALKDTTPHAPRRPEPTFRIPAVRSLAGECRLTKRSRAGRSAGALSPRRQLSGPSRAPSLSIAASHAAAVLGIDCTQVLASQRLGRADGDAQKVIAGFAAEHRRRSDRRTIACRGWFLRVSSAHARTHSLGAAAHVALSGSLASCSTTSGR